MGWEPGGLDFHPGAACDAVCSGWLSHRLITVWSGEMNGSYSRCNNYPLCRWIGTSETSDQRTRPWEGYFDEVIARHQR